MAHRIHSAYGASIGYGPEDWNYPFQGILQGNQFGPPSWALVSSPLFDMLRHEGFGLRLTSPLSKTQLHIAGKKTTGTLWTFNGKKDSGHINRWT